MEEIAVPTNEVPNMHSIPVSHLHKVCLVGQGADCCKYVLCGAGGFECAKGTGFAATLEARTDMHAKGDNCDGKDDIKEHLDA